MAGDSKIMVDIAPLRASREFRLLYGGRVVSGLGTQLTVVAAPIQVFGITHSTLAVGLLGLAQFPPLLIGSLLGGTIADAYDRRKVLIASQVLMLATSLGLAVNGAGANALWPVYVLTAMQAGVSGIDSPTRNAVIPNLVSREHLVAANSLSQISFQLAGVVGPAVAGVLIARFGVSAAYWVDVVTFVLATLTVVAMKAMPPFGGGRRAGLRSLQEGLRFLRGRQALQGTFIVDVNAMVFGLPRSLFPEMGLRVFGGGDAVVGLLYAAPGAGALVGALLSGWIPRVHRQGRAVIWAVVAWGLSIALFGLSTWLPLALVFLALAGAADVVSAVFRTTILHLTVPDSLRGRLSAVHIAVVTGGPRLGDAEAGGVAALAGVRASAVSGGVFCIVGALAIARLMPALGRWTLDDAEPLELTEP